jgi:hypothetical protein
LGLHPTGMPELLVNYSSVKVHDGASSITSVEEMASKTKGKN